MRELVLVLGKEGVGKTTKMRNIAIQLAKDNVPFIGVVSVAVFDSAMKIGYDALLLPKGEQLVLCRLKDAIEYPRWNFIWETFEYGNKYIAENISTCQVVLIDEVGSLEVEGSGWHSSIRLAFESGISRLYLSGRRERLHKYLEKFSLQNHFYNLFEIEIN